MGNLKDYATSTVLTPPSPADTGTTLDVQAGHGARFPAAPFFATLHPPAEFPTLDNAEKVLVTAKSTDTFTITRAQGSTTAQLVEAGWRISNTLFLADIPSVDSSSVDTAGAVMNSDTSTAAMNFVVDEDDMASNSATKLSTQQSIKAYVDASISAAKQALMPVGTIVVLGVSTDPNTLYGFGTWTQISGRVIVGQDSGQTEFDTLDETGGEKTHILTEAELAPHDHATDNGGDWGFSILRSIAGRSGGFNVHYGTGANLYVEGSNSGYGDIGVQTTTANAGSGAAHNNLQPYIVKYMWQRTA